jgi:peptide/nickel transport system substrate-binding protein
MQLTVCKWLVASSLLLSLTAVSETRPQYGGTLRVATSATLTSLDPADRTQRESFARNGITTLMFDTLVTCDGAGRVQPSLATSWENSTDDKRWRFRIRRDVIFHDGSALTPETAAASLRMTNPSWNVLAEADSVMIQSDTPAPAMPATLALPRNAIVKRNADHGIAGTGPFRISDWQTAKKLLLAANEDSWRGRPFLDAIEIEMGRASADQIASLEAGRLALIELPGEMLRRMSLSGHNMDSSAAMELIAIVFSRDVQEPDDMKLRAALALSLDRVSIHSVLLQGAGDTEGGILPDWMTGYGSLFPSQADLPRAKLLRQQVQSASTWTLKYDANDSLLRLLAERISLSAKDAGLGVKPVTDGASDAQLVRMVLPTTDAAVDLAMVAEAAGVPAPALGRLGVEDVYIAEQHILAARRVIPLLHLPDVCAATKQLRGWAASANGCWQLADAWLEASPQ